MNLLRNGAAWLNSTLRAAAAESVAYTRDADSVTLPATVGSSTHQVPDRDGFLVETVVRDFVIAAADLELAGVAVEPEQGDVIRQTVGGVVYLWEVAAPGPGQPVWSWCDGFQLRRRVHTLPRGTA